MVLLFLARMLTNAWKRLDFSCPLPRESGVSRYVQWASMHLVVARGSRGPHQGNLGKRHGPGSIHITVHT